MAKVPNAVENSRKFQPLE